MHNIPDPDLADPWRRLVSAGDNRIDHLPLYYLRLVRNTVSGLGALNAVKRLIFPLYSNYFGTLRFAPPCTDMTKSVGA